MKTMKDHIIWFAVMAAVVTVYLFATDAIGWAFGESDGTYVRRIVAFVAVCYFFGKVTDFLLKKDTAK